ncbi:hypothetical protein [Acidovorax sp. SUPP2825]|uniref:hypothetical protein n=1 Tax=Acidovorax sp. SUPP2825 TaxID=2920879 RepID=UPI0023DE536F|nr:hypothetical protein [Acidovorax sp. SUPP2825]GKS93227.1 hypothetical protein AVAK2825_01850 [Acidovorax sp. SUPP2825]
MQATSYIWAAEQTEPGANGVRYLATPTSIPPAAIKSVQAHPGLVYAESVYGDWELIGTAKGSCYTNEYGSFVELATPEMAGSPIEVEEVVRMNWFSRER